MYRADIDGLRAIAVLAVIGHHFDAAQFSLGYLGVDVFFVVSGFVISQSLLARRNQSLGLYLIEFYDRRIRRLFPALVFCIVLTVLLITPISVPERETASYIRSAVFALFGFSNVHFYLEGMNYFAHSSALNPFTHTWSLGVEEQFYFLYPLLLWLTTRSFRRGGRYSLLGIACGVLATLSFVAFVVASHMSPVAAFFLTPFRFWELSLGCLAYFIVSEAGRVRLLGEARIERGLFAALVVLLAVLLLPEFLNQLTATIVVAVTTFVIILGNSRSSAAWRLLTLKPLVFVGLISYSLYLWHWSVLVVARLTVGVGPTTTPFLLSAIFLLSYFSYRYIELPFRKSGIGLNGAGKASLREPVINILCAIALTVGLATVLIQGLAPLQQRGEFFQGEAAVLEKRDVKSLREVVRHGDDVWSVKLCALLSEQDVGKKVHSAGCTFGNLDELGRRFLVIGNSFSAAQVEMYKVLVDRGLGPVTITSCWGAAQAPGVAPKSKWKRANKYYWDVLVPRLIGELSPGDVVMMISDGADLALEHTDSESIQRLHVFELALEKFVSQLSSQGLYVVFQAGNPFMRDAGCTPNMALPQRWHLGRDPPCRYFSRKASLERRSAFHDALMKIEDRYDNFAVLDLFDLFCPSGLCKMYNRDGVFMYRDEWSHPSVEASVLARPLLLETINNLIATGLTHNAELDGGAP